MEIESAQFDKIRIIFEEILKNEGYTNFSEINGDNTEDFCIKILKKLDEFYANI